MGNRKAPERPQRNSHIRISCPGSDTLSDGLRRERPPSLERSSACMVCPWAVPSPSARRDLSVWVNGECQCPSDQGVQAQPHRLERVESRVLRPCESSSEHQAGGYKTVWFAMQFVEIRLPVTPPSRPPPRTTRSSCAPLSAFQTFELLAAVGMIKRKKALTYPYLLAIPICPAQKSVSPAFY